MLTHRNWKFEKFISLKINTDDLGPFRATTADNVVLETVATLNWRVEDPTLAARMAADTMPSTYSNTSLAGSASTPTLQRDVLKMAVASLAAAVGSIRYADDVHIAASSKLTLIDDKDKAQASAAASIAGKASSSMEDDYTGVSRIFSVQQMSSAVQHANEICSKYGVSVVSINVISAVPVDRCLEEALSAGAVAAAGAQQAEIAARGNAKAKLISMQSEAEAVRINAQARADAERLEAQGKKDAAKLLETSDVAVDLARLEKAGQLIGEKASFFFGTNPQAIPALLSNPKVTG